MQSESQMGVIMKYIYRSFNYRIALEFLVNVDKQIHLQIYLIAFCNKIPVYPCTYKIFYHTAYILLSPKMLFSEIDLLNWVNFVYIKWECSAPSKPELPSKGSWWHRAPFCTNYVQAKVASNCNCNSRLLWCEAWKSLMEKFIRRTN